MAKKIKFPLEMKNGVMVRTLEELQDNFDLNKIIGYFLDGKLLTWLEARSCYDEIRVLQSLEKNDTDLHQKLCKIFHVEYESHGMNTVDIEDIEEQNRRLAELKQYTSDSEILSKIDQVAFDQEDLADLIDEGIYDIYLCNNIFSIPLRIENKCYIGIGKSIATIRSKTEIDFTDRKIEFINIEFDDAYAQILMSNRIQNQKDEDYVATNEKSDVDDVKSLYMQGEYLYNGGKGDRRAAAEYYKKASDLGFAPATNMIGIIIESDVMLDFCTSRDDCAIYYERAAQQGSIAAMANLGRVHISVQPGGGGSAGFANHFRLAAYWLTQAAERGFVEAMLALTILYTTTSSKFQQIDEAYQWCCRAAATGSMKAARLKMIMDAGTVSALDCRGIDGLDYFQAFYPAFRDNV